MDGWTDGTKLAPLGYQQLTQSPRKSAIDCRVTGGFFSFFFFFAEERMWSESTKSTARLRLQMMELEISVPCKKLAFCLAWMSEMPLRMTPLLGARMHGSVGMLYHGQRLDYLQTHSHAPISFFVPAQSTPRLVLVSLQCTAAVLHRSVASRTEGDDALPETINKRQENKKLEIRKRRTKSLFP